MRVRGYQQISQTCVDRVGAADDVTCQCQLPAGPSMCARQEVTGADLGKQANIDLGHRHFRACRDNARPGDRIRLRESHAPPMTTPTISAMYGLGKWCIR